MLAYTYIFGLYFMKRKAERLEREKKLSTEVSIGDTNNKFSATNERRKLLFFSMLYRITLYYKPMVLKYTEQSLFAIICSFWVHRNKNYLVVKGLLRHINQ